MILQDPTLFNGTIRSNIDPFSLYDDKHLWKTLDDVRICCIDCCGF